ncbi:MAG: hypothetical protein DRJ43_07155 [Thermoprotei archaeon]|nr:MAG: hypothetical protein DRJ43_07155 [Thermoprotei archaeon]
MGMGALEEKVIKSINKVFLEVFGSIATAAIRSHLMSEGLDLNDPSLDLERFHGFLLRFFGDGARALEEAIVDDLYRSLNLPKPEPMTLLEAVKRLKDADIAK